MFYKNSSDELIKKDKTLFIIIGIFSVLLLSVMGYVFYIKKFEKMYVTKAEFEIKLPGSEKKYSSTGINSENIKNVNIIKDLQAGTALIEIVLDSKGLDMFESITEQNIGKPVAIFVDNVPISVPTIQQTITDGKILISGNFTTKDEITLLNFKARLLGYYYKNSDEYKNFEILNIKNTNEEKDITNNRLQVRVSHILICYFGAAKCESHKYTKEQAFVRAQELFEKADATNFAELAKNNSSDPTAKINGGDLGFFERDSMVKEFSDAVFDAQVGQIIGPVETEFGYHIIYKTDEKKL